MRAQGKPSRICKPVRGLLECPVAGVFMVSHNRGRSRASVDRDSLLISGGLKLRVGELMFHADGACFTGALCRRAVGYRVDEPVLSLFARPVTENDVTPPPSGCVIRLRAAIRLQYCGCTHARHVVHHFVTEYRRAVGDIPAEFP